MLNNTNSGNTGRDTLEITLKYLFFHNICAANNVSTPLLEGHMKKKKRTVKKITCINVHLQQLLKTYSLKDNCTLWQG